VEGLHDPTSTLQSLEAGAAMSTLRVQMLCSIAVGTGSKIGKNDGIKDSLTQQNQ
jgi:hypothetical protein